MIEFDFHLMTFPVLGFFWAAFFYIAKMAAVIAISYAVSRALAPKTKQKAAGASEFELPTSMEGRAVPHVRGKRWVKDMNVLTPIYDYYKEKVAEDGNTIGYKYYFGLWAGLCRSCDGIKMIMAGGKVIWPVKKDPDTEAADGVTTGQISCENIFGGKKKEGGQSGIITILYGGSTQTLPDYLSQNFGSTIPPARGVVSIMFGDVPSYTYVTIGPWTWRITNKNGFYWGTTTYPKWPQFLLKSTDKDASGNQIWQPSYANVGDDDFNPIHAIYEWITDAKVGRGLSTSLIGTSFAAAAQTCHSEGYGISYELNASGDELQEYIDTVCEIIDGALYFDQENGTFEIALARDDYTPGDLELFDESDFWVEEYHRPSPGTTPSCVTVKFTDRITDDQGVGQDDDIALLEIQGAQPVEQELDYTAYICSQEVADMVAAREQRQYSAMPASLTLRALRTMAQIHPGSVFKISYPALGITSMIVRALFVDKGNLDSEEVIINVVEDVYGAVYTVFGTPSIPSSLYDDEEVDTSCKIVFTTNVEETGPYDQPSGFGRGTFGSGVFGS